MKGKEPLQIGVEIMIFPVFAYQFQQHHYLGMRGVVSETYIYIYRCHLLMSSELKTTSNLIDERDPLKGIDSSCMSVFI